MQHFSIFHSLAKKYSRPRMLAKLAKMLPIALGVVGLNSSAMTLYTYTGDRLREGGLNGPYLENRLVIAFATEEPLPPNMVGVTIRPIAFYADSGSGTFSFSSEKYSDAPPIFSGFTTTADGAISAWDVTLNFPISTPAQNGQIYSFNQYGIVSRWNTDPTASGVFLDQRFDCTALLLGGPCFYDKSATPGTWQVDYDAVLIPEPASSSMLAIGLILLFGATNRLKA